MLLRLARWMAFLGIFLAMFTKSEAEGLARRILLADWMFIASMVFWAMNALVTRRLRLSVPKPLAAYGGLILCLALGLITSLNPNNTLTELLVLCFLLAVALLLYQLFCSEAGFEQLIQALTWTGLIAAVFGIAEAAFNLDVRVFGFAIGDSAEGRVTGTFRNTGQAGAFIYMCMLPALSKALAGGNIVGQLRARNFYAISAMLMIVALMLTVKMASMIGLAVSLVLVLFAGGGGVMRRVLLFLPPVALSALGALYFFMQNAAYSAYFQFKFFDRISGIQDSDGFWQTNIAAAFNSFTNNPFFGSSIGGFTGNFDSHEVHSTYFKMLGEGGFFGVLGYALFMLTWLLALLRAKFSHSVYGHYIQSFLPLLAGAIVSWTYNYHLRKREFWIMFVISLIAIRLSQTYREKRHGA